MIPKLLCLGTVLGKDDADTVRASGIIDRAEGQDLALLRERRPIADVFHHRRPLAFRHVGGETRTWRNEPKDKPNHEINDTDACNVLARTIPELYRSAAMIVRATPALV
jgi:hypothetical protein